MSKATPEYYISDRIKALRDLMKNEGIDACIVPTGDPHMSEYISDHYKTREFITGFTGSAGTAVITSDNAGLWTDSRYFLQAAEELSGSGIQLYKDRLPDTLKIEDFLKQNLSSGSTLCVDGRLMSSSRAENLRKAMALFGVTLRTDLDLVGEIWSDRPTLEFNTVVDYPLEFAGVSRNEKVRLIREDMVEAGADVLILSSLSDIAWLLNLRGSDVLCNPVFFSFVIITPDTLRLYVNMNSFSHKMAAELTGDGVELLPYECFYDQLKHLGDLGADNKDLAVMLDCETSSDYLVQSLPKATKIINRESPAMLRKAVKNATEREGIYSAHLKDGIAMCKFIYWLKKNIASQEITELSAADKLHEFRQAQDLYKGESFEPIVGYGPHAAIVHYSATEASDMVLEPQGMVLIDSGGQYLDGTTDITRTIVLGPISEREKTLFTAVLRGHIDLAKAKFAKGLNGANLDYLAHAPLWELGLDYGHGTGHGVGHYLNVHEDPNAIVWNGKNRVPAMPPFEEGMLTSDEPGYYEEGAFGIRHESLLLCLRDEETECGEFLHFDEVTLVPFDLEGIDAEKMQPDEKEYLNEYHKTVYEKIAPHLNDEEREWLLDATKAI